MGVGSPREDDDAHLRKELINSSEEEEDVENEEDRGFINDEESESEDSSSDSEDSEAETLAKRKNYSEDELDEDDLALIEENMGIRLPGSERNFKRIKSRTSAKERDANLENLFDEENESEDEDEDNMDDFVVYDYGKEEKAPTIRKEPRRARQQKASPSKSHISASALQEAQELFDDSCYLFALEEIEKDDKQDSKSREQVFEPSVLIEKLYTSEDDAIRSTDIPERFQLRDGRNRKVTPDELEKESLFVLAQLSKTKAYQRDDNYQSNLLKSIAAVLQFFRVEYLEPPFIFYHRREYIYGYLDLDDLWTIYDLDATWKNRHKRRDELIKLYNLMYSKFSQEISKENHQEAMEFLFKIENIDDIHEYLQYHYSTQMKKLGTRIPGIAKSALPTIEKFDKVYKEYGITPKMFAENLASNYKRHEVHDSSISPDTLLDESTRTGFVQACAVEMFHHPEMRVALRNIFIKEAVISTFPTEKGKQQITNQSEFYPIKYITEKPVSALCDDEYFLFQAAEKAGELEILISFRNEQDVVMECQNLYTSSMTTSAWNDLRNEVWHHALEFYFIPLLCREVKQNLTNSASDYITKRMYAALYTQLLQAPIKDVSHESNKNPLFVAVSWGDGSLDTCTYAVALNEYGVIVDYIKISFLQDRNRKDAGLALLSDFIKKHEPFAVGVAGTTLSTRLLYNEVEIICKSVDISHTPTVSLLNDSIARIFERSHYGTNEFPKFPALLKYCVSIGRRMIDPMHEICRLFNADLDILNLRLCDQQEYVPRNKRMAVLERAAINAVNFRGIPINHYMKTRNPEYLVQFISGLGIRKAQQLLKKIEANDGYLSSREELDSYLGKAVYLNCAAFFLIHEPSGIRVSRKEFDVLDSTRIHPENYFLARKMAADALDLEDLDNESSPQYIEEVMLSPEKLNDLLLDEYAKELEKRQGIQKQITLHDIKNELQNPHKERLKPFSAPTADDIFEMLTGETDRTLFVGQIRMATITRVMDKHAIARLENGISGLIPMKYMSDSHVQHPEEVVKLNQVVKCKVMAVNKEKFGVDLSLRDSDINESIDPSRISYFDVHREKRDLIENEKNLKQQQDEKIINRRIVHPHFKNVNRQKAIQYLSSRPNGSVVLRPSSKGVSNLTMTWKVTDDLFQHVDIIEKDKTDDQSLGKKLIIGDQQYDDLDEILARYLEPILAYNRELVSHPKFTDDIDEKLKQEKAANPGRIAYGFHYARDYPGKFMISYIPGEKRRDEYISVTPLGLKFRNRFFESPNELMNWFKVNYNKVTTK